MELASLSAEPDHAVRSIVDGQTLIESIDPLALGRVQFVQVESDLWVANLLGQQGMSVRNGVPPVRYEAIRSGLRSVGAKAKELSASVHMPRIGCGLAGGKWEEIEPILKDELISAGISVRVYNFRPP